MMITKKKLKEIKLGYDNDGYVVIRNFFNKENAEKIKKKLFIFLNSKKSKLQKREMHLAKNSKHINSIHHLKWPYVNKLKKNKSIVKIVKILLEDKIKVLVQKFLPNLLKLEWQFQYTKIIFFGT